MKGHIIAITLFFIGSIITGCMAITLFFIGSIITDCMPIKAQDQEWLINYSKATGIPVEDMRLVSDKSECTVHERFNAMYGICIK